jgi:serine/threonine-protein kinase 24/25/MST4
MYQATVRQSGVWGDSLRSDWAFETVTASAMGTFRSAARDLMPAGMIPDEEDGESVRSVGSVFSRDEDQSMQAAHGSDVTVQQQAAHSTTNIRPPEAEPDMESLVEEEKKEEAEAEADAEASSPAQGQGPPPAYQAGSLRGQRRSSYGRRTSVDGRGISLREADLGTGVDTIRPVKKVDKEGSLRLSADFVGSLRQRSQGGTENDVTSSPSTSTAMPSPVSPKSSAKRQKATEAEKAGAAMVTEIVLPLLQKTTHDDMDAREIEGLSMLSRGFEELREVNPALAYNVILDILSGINEYDIFPLSLLNR